MEKDNKISGGLILLFSVCLVVGIFSFTVYREVGIKFFLILAGASGFGFVLSIIVMLCERFGKINIKIKN